MDEEDISDLNSIGIVLDKPIYLGNVAELSHIILNITYEHHSADIHNDNAKRHYTELLLIKLSRLAVSCSKTQRTSSTDVRASLINLRRIIYDEPDKAMKES